MTIHWWPSTRDRVFCGSQPVENLLKLIHAYGAYALIALVLVHAAAALRHHFILKDDVLTRMLPARLERPPEPAIRKETSR